MGITEYKCFQSLSRIALRILLGNGFEGTYITVQVICLWGCMCGGEAGGAVGGSPGLYITRMGLGGLTVPGPLRHLKRKRLQPQTPNLESYITA